MSIKRKIKKRGNEVLDNYSFNPIVVEHKEKKKSFLRWAKIISPIGTATIIGVVIALVVVNTASSNNKPLESQKINTVNKSFNSNYKKHSDNFINKYFHFINYLYENDFAKHRNFTFSPMIVLNFFYTLYDSLGDEYKEIVKDDLFVDDDSFNHLEEIKKMNNNSFLEKESLKSDNVSCVILYNQYKDLINEYYLDLLTNYYYSDVLCASSNDFADILARYTEEKMGFSYIPNVSYSQQSGQITFLLNNIFSASWACDIQSSPDNHVFYNSDGYISSGVKHLKYDTDDYSVTSIYDEEDFYIFSLPLSEGFNFNVLYPKNKENADAVLYDNFHYLLNRDDLISKDVKLHLSFPKMEKVMDEWPLNTLSSFDNEIFNNDYRIKIKYLSNLFDLDKNDTIKNDYLNIAVEQIPILHITENGVSLITKTDNLDHKTEDAFVDREIIEAEDTNITIDHSFAFTITDGHNIPYYVHQTQSRLFVYD